MRRLITGFGLFVGMFTGIVLLIYLLNRWGYLVYRLFS